MIRIFLVQAQFSALVDAMKSVGAGTSKKNKSSREKNYACKVLLPQEITETIDLRFCTVEVSEQIIFFCHFLHD